MFRGIVLALSICGAVFITVSANADSLSNEINNNIARMNSMIAQQQANYNRWIRTLPPERRRIVEGMNAIYNNYERTHDSVPSYNERNVAFVAKSLKVGEDDIDFLREQMQSRTETDQKLREMTEEGEAGIDSACTLVKDFMPCP